MLRAHSPVGRWLKVSSKGKDGGEVKGGMEVRQNG